MLITRRVTARQALVARSLRRLLSDRPFEAGDSVILRRSRDRSSPPVFIDRLQAGRRRDTHKGSLQHDDIIGKCAREVIVSQFANPSKDPVEFRLHQVTLHEYVTLTRRLVTPLYPQDAQLIVGLMDLHPEPERADDIEILEAGTGHGALTLFLGRAVHAAARSESTKERSSGSNGGQAARDNIHRPLIHSVELDARHSQRAQEVVRGFRHGIYADNVAFHVRDVSGWVQDELARRDGQPFLSHAFLDLPGSDGHLSQVASALRSDGTLIVFNPSVTQIMECVLRVKTNHLALELERVIELGVNGGSGGREWDIRAVKPRKNSSVNIDGVEPLESPNAEGEEVTSSLPSAELDTDDVWKMICRPKVGEMVVGGGFLGVFKKKRETPHLQDSS